MSKIAHRYIPSRAVLLFWICDGYTCGPASNPNFMTDEGNTRGGAARFSTRSNKISRWRGDRQIDAIGGLSATRLLTCISENLDGTAPRGKMRAADYKTAGTARAGEPARISRATKAARLNSARNAR